MLFSSNVFLFLFLPVSLIGYQVLKRARSGVILSWLTLVSLFFYGFWNPAYLVLLLASILLNFLAAGRIAACAAEERRQSRWLVIAIVGNLLLLMYFKYLFPLLGFLQAHRLFLHDFGSVVLPLGISFFTFTQIAYLIDLKQGIAERQGLISYSLFVTFFPHLIAGPIIHPREMMPQFASGRLRRGLNEADLRVGATWFIMGLGKKVLLADRFAPVADAVFGHPHGFGTAGTWVGVLAYTMQLYFDFSGYSDMALGIARMFSIEFPVNFNSPYKSQSVVEFWSRWHMTLSRYLNEYLYHPISHAIRVRRTSEGKKSTRKVFGTVEGFTQLIIFPTMTTMFLAGVWHGAGMHYVMYGVVFGVYICVYHLWQTLVPAGSALRKPFVPAVSIGVTYLCVVCAFLMFRASSVGEAVYLLGSMLGLHGAGAAYTGNALLAGVAYFGNMRGAVLGLTMCFAIVWFLPNTQQILDQLPEEDADERLLGWQRGLLWQPTLLWGACASLVLTLSILLLDSGGAFLYFQF